MKKENMKYFYRIEITTWQEEQGSEEWLTYAREFKSTDLLQSQQQALAAWNKQMQSFEKGEIMPGFLGPKDSEEREWNWIEKAEAELLFIEMDGDNEYAFLLSGGLEEQARTGRDAEKYALKTLGYKNKGMFD